MVSAFRDKRLKVELEEVLTVRSRLEARVEDQRVLLHGLEALALGAVGAHRRLALRGQLLLLLPAQSGAGGAGGGD